MEIEKLRNPTHITETETVFCCLLDGSIFYSYYKPGTTAVIEDTRFIFNQYKEFNRQGPMKVLAEMGPHSSLDKPSREFLQEHKVKAICEALVITNLAQRLILNFYLGVKSHGNPSKVFKSRKNALEWINSLE